MKTQRNHGRALIIVPILILVVSIQTGMLLKLTSDQRLISQTYARHNNKYFLARSGIYMAVDILNEIVQSISADESFYLQIHEKLINYCTYIAGGGANEFKFFYAIEFYDNYLRHFDIEVTIRCSSATPTVFYLTAYAKEDTEYVGSMVKANAYRDTNGQVVIKSLKEVK